MYFPQRKTFLLSASNQTLNLILSTDKIIKRGSGIFWWWYVARFYCILRESGKILRDRFGLSKRLEKALIASLMSSSCDSVHKTIAIYRAPSALAE